jgi:hypothetical protein
MHLVQILLPLSDNDGRRLPRALFADLARELIARFGGLTAHTRAPAQGLWLDDAPADPERAAERAVRDEIVIYEVMAEEVDEAWWRDRRGALERDFRQETIVVRAQEIRLL